MRVKLLTFFLPIIFIHPVYAAPLFSTADIDAIKTHLFTNIATDKNKLIKSDGMQTIHSLPGAVEASPSNKDKGLSQDYQFHWTRDAALTMQTVVGLYQQGNVTEKKQLATYLNNYIEFERKAQQQISKAGEETLGQPKFNLDGTIWEGEWMRPQNDGPALRAITLIEIATTWRKEGKSIAVNKQLIPLIATDLNYVCSDWQQKSYGLWEEILDQDHFFNKMVQRKALILGAALFKQLGMPSQAVRYQQTARQISHSLANHWNEALGYYSETIQQQYIKGGGLDSSILLGVIYGNLNDNKDPYAIDNNKILSSIYFIQNTFANLYKINLQHPKQQVLLGRYPSDIYDGDQFKYGNPWVLITHALAQYYYELATTYLTKAQINIDQTNLLFFKQLNSSIKTSGLITRKNNPKQFEVIIQSLLQRGDNILLNVKKYASCYPDHTCYHLTEQIDRSSGKEASVKDLTWNYATLLSALAARDRITSFHS